MYRQNLMQKGFGLYEGPDWRNFITFVPYITYIMNRSYIIPYLL